MFLNNSNFHADEEDEFLWDDTSLNQKLDGYNQQHWDSANHQDTGLLHDDDQDEFLDPMPSEAFAPKPSVPTTMERPKFNPSSSMQQQNSAFRATPQPAPIMANPEPSLPGQTPSSNGLASPAAPKSPSNNQLAPLSEKQKKLYASHIKNLNQHIVQMILSSQWMHRIQGLYYLKNVACDLGSAAQNTDVTKDLEKKLASCFDMLNLMLKDKVLKVYLVALEVVESLVHASEPLGSITTRRLFDPIVSTLLFQLSNKTKKFVKATESCFHLFCSQKAIGVNFIQGKLTQFNPNELKDEQQRKAASVSMMNRLSLLSSLLDKFGIASSEFDVAFEPDPIVRLASSLLEYYSSSDQNVKAAAAQLLTQVYIKKPKFCLSHFKKLDPQNLKYLASYIEKQTNQQYTIDVESIDKQNLLQEFTSEDEEDLKDNISDEEMTRMKNHIRQLSLPGLMNLLSKKWNKRNSVMEDLREICAHGNIISLNDSVNVRHFIQLSSMPLEDNNPRVFVTSTKMLRELFCVDVYRIHDVDRIFIQDLLRKYVMPSIISKIGNMNSQVNKHCIKILVDFSRSEKIGSRFVSEFLVEPESDSTFKQWKTVCGKLHILQKLIEVHRFAPDSLSMESVMSYVVAAFSSRNHQVRQDAVQTIVEVYKRAGNVIQTYLKNQKPALMKELREKVMKEAHSSRTNSAPINRLAAIVRPFGFEDQGSSSLATSPVKERGHSKSITGMMHSSNSAFGQKKALGAGKDFSSVPLSSQLSSTPFRQASTAQPSTGRKSRFVFS